jgi:hypothetical protein
MCNCCVVRDNRVTAGGCMHKSVGMKLLQTTTPLLLVWAEALHGCTERSQKKHRKQVHQGLYSAAYYVQRGISFVGSRLHRIAARGLGTGPRQHGYSLGPLRVALRFVAWPENLMY